MLIILLLLPALFAAFTWIFKKNQAVTLFAIIASSFQLAYTLFLLWEFNPAAGFGFETRQTWIPAIGIDFHVAVDGIGMLMLLLTNLLMLLVMLAGLKKNKDRPQLLYLLLLLAQSALNGVFISLNAFLFYIFWELTLIPLYFILLLWGGENRQKITLKFFLFTLAGSLLMLFAFIFIYLKTAGNHSADISSFYNTCLEPSTQKWLFWLIFAGFAVKIPVFPLHNWQASTYTTAPLQGTMILAGIMSKMGIYGMLRWLLPVIPWAVYQWRDLVIILSLSGVLYAGIIAFRQKDLKSLAAWSSLSHTGLIVAGIFAFNIFSLQGVMLQVFAHAINIAGLFYIIDMIERRTYSRNPADLGGIKTSDPKLAAFFMIILLGSIALPLTNSFAGEFLIFTGIFKVNGLYMIIGGLSIIIGAVYMLYIYQKTMLGETNELTSRFMKTDWKEMMVLVPVSTLIILFGIFPQPLIEMVKYALQNLLF